MNMSISHKNCGAIACVGAGLVGCAWAVVFAKAGFRVSMHDSDASVLSAASRRIRQQLGALSDHGLLGEPADDVADRVSIAASLKDAVNGAIYIQESILERVDLKRELLTTLDSLDDGEVIVGSSTSGIPASAFATGLRMSERVLVVHPVNPPSLIPLVELVPSPSTSDKTLAFARELMFACGQSPITVRREIDGFVLNRLQAVLLREAWALVQDGVASVEDIDKTVRDGLGWRWSFMGPFETIDLNAVGGVADYARRLDPLYQGIAASRVHTEAWGTELIAEVEAQRRRVLSQDQLQDRAHWRDLRLMAFARHMQSVQEKDNTQEASSS